jgi:hypothetical protein
VCLVARYFEAAGVPTVILGSALDIVEHCGVPRFVYSDMPLGNPCGKPFDREMQRAIVAQTVDVLQTADKPRTTVKVPYPFSGDGSWRERYLEVRAGDAARLAKLGAERRAQRQRVRDEGRVRED